MKELMQKILQSNDKGLIDDVLREAGLVIQLIDGQQVFYVGNGMTKNSVGNLSDLMLDSIESITVGEPPSHPEPILSTEEAPNGVPIEEGSGEGEDGEGKVEGSTQQPNDSENHTAGDKDTQGEAQGTTPPEPTTPPQDKGTGAKGGKPLFNV